MGGDAYLSWCMVDGAPWPTRQGVRFEGLRWGLDMFWWNLTECVGRTVGAGTDLGKRLGGLIQPLDNFSLSLRCIRDTKFLGRARGASWVWWP
jgi:hypothetical protein